MWPISKEEIKEVGDKKLWLIGPIALLDLGFLHYISSSK
jgi:hypothetical protein